MAQTTRARWPHSAIKVRAVAADAAKEGDGVVASRTIYTAPDDFSRYDYDTNYRHMMRKHGGGMILKVTDAHAGVDAIPPDLPMRRRKFD